MNLGSKSDTNYFVISILSHDVFDALIAKTHMCLLYGICIVLNSVPLSLDLTVNGPRPWQLNTQFSKKSNSTRTGERNHSRRLTNVNYLV